MPVRSHAARAAGRSVELEAMREAYRGACRGEVRLLLVDGPSSSGKGGLIDAWLSEHRAGPVIRVHAGAAGTAETLLERALAHLSPVRRARHAARALLATEPPRDGVVDLLALAEHRLRLREEVERVLGELGANDNPPVVVLDGLNAECRSALDLLTFLVEEAPFSARPPLLVLAALDGAAIGRVAALSRADVARTLTLKPLDREGVRAFLSSADAVDAVLALTGGQPELIEKLLRGDGFARPTALDERARAALELLALAITPLDDATLAALGVAPEVLADGLLLGSGAERGASGWTLPAALRHRVGVGVGPDRAPAIHAQLADALQAPELAARHALRAGRTERAAALALEGAEALVARGASVDAADLLLAIASAQEDPPLELRRRLVELLWIAGDHADAIEHARAYAERDPSGRLLHGRLLALAGRSAEALSTLERALEDVADHHRSDRDRSLAEVALADARYAAGDLDGAEALALALEGATDLALALEAGNLRGKIALARGELDRAEVILQGVLARAEAARLDRAACMALNNLSIAAMGKGELERATEHLTRMLELADEDGAVFFRGIAHKNLAVVGQLEGAWQDALRHAERALSLLGGLGNPSLAARLAFNTADLHRSLGDPYRALRLCAHARQQAAHELDGAVRGEGLRVEAAIHVELGHALDAVRAYEQALELAIELGHAAAADEARLGLANLALDAGDARRAQKLRELVSTAGGSARTELRVALVDARLADPGDRVPLGRLAVAAAERTSDPLLLQVAHVELARALHDAGLTTRAAEELIAIRAREEALTARVPEALRELFRERSVVRGVAALERELAGASAAVPVVSPAGASAMIGQTGAMQALRSFIERVGPSECTVLVTGESGTGKELVAEALHAASSRAERPFVRVNCAALVETLLSSELFGHERGAFTGADRQKLGRFELANGGTILLDEIGDISPRMQAALLRVLQERTFERVGGTRTQRVDVRVIAATHRDLGELVQAGTFREDLYYRLSGIAVRVPSLRERLQDLPVLTRHLLSKIAKETGTAPKMLAPDALDRLASHGWPGNIRELENALRSAAVLAPGALLTAVDFDALGGAGRSARPASAPPPGDGSLSTLVYERVRDTGSIYDLRKRLERDLIERVLGECDGNISKAADFLGMKRPRLSKLVNEWGLK